MTVKRELSSDAKPQLARLITGDSVGVIAGPKIVAPYSADRSTPPSSTSAMATMSPAASTPCESTSDDGACWNLVPYDVPWGQDYYHYEAGTLPGPDGKCLFLRSPTPVEKRRTLQACKMCRERKAKCSGDKPACARCLARGYMCQYLPEVKKVKPVKSGAIRMKVSRAFSHPYGRRDSDSFSIASSAELSEYSSYSSASSSSYFSPKQEEQEFPPAILLQQLQYPEEEEITKQEAPQTSKAYLPAYTYVPQPTQGYNVHEQPPLSATSTSSSLSFWSGYESPHPPTQMLAPAPTYPTFYAPRPLRYSQSLPMLPSSERRISCPADVINRPQSAEPLLEMAAATTVDPRVLTQQPMDAVYYRSQEVARQQHYIGESGVGDDQWHMQNFNSPEQYSMAMLDSTTFMQQYCNISPVTQYAESHPIEPHLCENAAPPHSGQYEAAVQVQAQHYVSPAGDYGIHSFVATSASPTFS